MNFGLSQKTVNKLRSFILNIPEIEDLKVFGSRAIGTYKEGSDIDLIHYETITNPDLKKHID